MAFRFNIKRIGTDKDLHFPGPLSEIHISDDKFSGEANLNVDLEQLRDFGEVLKRFSTSKDVDDEIETTLGDWESDSKIIIKIRKIDGSGHFLTSIELKDNNYFEKKSCRLEMHAETWDIIRFGEALLTAANDMTTEIGWSIPAVPAE